MIAHLTLIYQIIINFKSKDITGISRNFKNKINHPRPKHSISYSIKNNREIPKSFALSRIARALKARLADPPRRTDYVNSFPKLVITKSLTQTKGVFYYNFSVF